MSLCNYSCVYAYSLRHFQLLQDSKVDKNMYHDNLFVAMAASCIPPIAIHRVNPASYSSLLAISMKMLTILQAPACLQTNKQTDKTIVLGLLN